MVRGQGMGMVRDEVRMGRMMRWEKVCWVAREGSQWERGLDVDWVTGVLAEAW